MKQQSHPDDLKLYLDHIAQFADQPFVTKTLLQWLAPSAVQLGQQPLPPDGLYYTIQEHVVILRTAQPVAAVVWWPFGGDHDMIRELHITPTAPTIRYMDLLQSLAPGPEIRRHQGSPFADIEHSYHLSTPKGQNLELTLHEMVFPAGSDIVGLLGELVLRKIGADRITVKTSPPPRPAASATQLTLEHHLMMGRWQTVDKQMIADVIDFEAATQEIAGKRGNVFRTYARKELIDEGIWNLEAEDRIRMIWKSGLIRSFDLMVKGDRLVLRDKSGLFRYKRKRTQM